MILERVLANKLIMSASVVTRWDIQDDGQEALEVLDGDNLNVRVEDDNGLVLHHGIMCVVDGDMCELSFPLVALWMASLLRGAAAALRLQVG